MDFTNHQITLSDLPKMEEASLHPLEPSYLTTQRIAIAITTLLIIVAAVLFYFLVEEVKESTWFYIVFGALMLLMVIVYIGNLVSFKMKGYAIREKDVMYRTGWIVQRTRIVPLNRVQHVSVQSGPI